MSSSSWFYAVANGRQVGIYPSWKEAQKQITGFPDPRYKKFATEQEAQQFIDDYHNGKDKYRKTKKTEICYDQGEPEDSLIVFTDGATPSNGKQDAKSSFATVWPYHPAFNFVDTFPDEEKQTNNRAELRAILKAFEQADIVDPSREKTLIIFTDSMFNINVATNWIFRWHHNGWKKPDNKEPANLDLIKILFEYLSLRKVSFHHVKAHTGGSDWKSIYNDMVDRLATSVL